MLFYFINVQILKDIYYHIAFQRKGTLEKLLILLLLLKCTIQNISLDFYVVFMTCALVLRPVVFYVKCNKRIEWWNLRSGVENGASVINSSAKQFSVNKMATHKIINFIIYNNKYMFEIFHERMIASDIFYKVQKKKS